MKNLILSIVIATMLAACGKSGGGDGGSSVPGHVVDSSPHSYTIGIFDGDGSAASAHIVEVCDFGLSTASTHTFDPLFNPPSTSANMASGCGPVVHNLTVDLVNTGAHALYFEVYIDDVLHPELEVAVLAGQSMPTFQRGF
jgi:hypothetical protein